MKISRTKFAIAFVISAFVFIFACKFILDQPSEWLWITPSQAPWQSTISAILWPIRIVLMGPLLPFINFLRQEPDTPPPFFMIGFVMYWTLLALVIHYLVNKIKGIRSKPE
jgi:hypothetical protein